MDAAGFCKSRLGRAQTPGELDDFLQVHFQRRFDRGKMLMDRFNGSLAAQAATRRGKDVAGQSAEINFYGRRKKDVEGVFVIRQTALLAISNFGYVVAIMDDSFSKQKSGGQFIIMARRAHGYGHALSTHADFERLFDGEIIRLGFRLAAKAPMPDLRRRDFGAGFFSSR